MYKYFLKQVIDIIGAFILLLFTLPVTFIITLILVFENDGEPFFLQKRPGKNEKLFNIIKFKTMNDKKDKLGNLLPDVERLTKIGKFIRKTSLDEIPQLLNVLKGDMSLIGPRPLLVQYLPLYNQIQKKRHNVRPGITGWAQVNGRNAISWQKKFEFDVWYVQNMNIMLDINIVFLTIKKVLNKEGISAPDSVSMEVFKGDEIC